MKISIREPEELIISQTAKLAPMLSTDYKKYILDYFAWFQELSFDDYMFASEVKGIIETEGFFVDKVSILKIVLTKTIDNSTKVEIITSARYEGAWLSKQKTWENIDFNELAFEVIRYLHWMTKELIVTNTQFQQFRDKN